MFSRMSRACWLLAGIVALSAPKAVAAQGDMAAMIARIEGVQRPALSPMDSLTLDAVMKRLHVPGVSIAVIWDFQIHWAKSYGVADVETGRPVVLNTPFQAASISKPLTAMAALRLVQEQRLALDGDIGHRLPILRKFFFDRRPSGRQGQYWIRNLDRNSRRSLRSRRNGKSGARQLLRLGMAAFCWHRYFYVGAADLDNRWRPDDNAIRGNDDNHIGRQHVYRRWRGGIHHRCSTNAY